MAKIKVLVVDDDESTRQMYTEIFSGAGFEVVEARDGVEGLDVTTKETPDVIFTGIIMPRMDGFTFIQALKKNVATANIPVIISSHMGREEDQQKATVLGARDFVVRGLTSPNEVVKKIKNLFETKGVTYRLEINPAALDGPKLTGDLNLAKDFLCPECQGKLAVDLTPTDIKERKFEAHILCPGCGKVVK